MMLSTSAIPQEDFAQQLSCSPAITLDQLQTSDRHRLDHTSSSQSGSVHSAPVSVPSCGSEAKELG